MDVDIIKQAARGRWAELFVSLGIPAETFPVSETDKTEHPCPKCGGNTRFRLVDRDDGALLCSHCFNQKNGDGLAAVQWWTGCTFPEACKKAADFFGVKVDSKKKSKAKRPEDHLRFLDDNDALWGLWLAGHEPITLAAVKAAGGRLARFHDRDSVVAFPYHGEGEGKVTGWEMRPLTANGSIHQWEKEKKQFKKSPKLACPGSEKNLMGPVDKIADAEIVVRAEGLTDTLIAGSVLPPGWVTVGVAGSSNPKPWQAELFAGKVVVVVGDTDDSGQESAAKWAQAIAKHAASVKVPLLPYQHTESGGRDLRDFLVEHGATAFLSLVENTAEFEPERDEKGIVKDVGPPTDEERSARCLVSLGLDVIGEDRANAIHVYSRAARKIFKIPDIDRLKRSKLIQHARDPISQYVPRSGDPESHQFRMSEVQEAIAWAASDRQIDPDELLGRGLWFIDGRVVACNGNHLSVWNGESLEYLEVPYFGPEVFEFPGARKNWFDHEEMVELCGQAKNPQWCRQVMDRLVELLERWSWEDDKWAPKLIASLIPATFLQSAWKIRPHITFSGVSGCGKSDCMKFLFGEEQETGVFGHLRWFVTDASSAGISQGVGNQSLAIAIDEWDKQKPRMKEELLELLRAMSTGGVRVRGSAHGKGRTEVLRHMLWFAGITAGLEEAADLNRVIQVGMQKKPGTPKWQGFRMPDPVEAVEIGKKLVAGMIVNGAAAVKMSSEIESQTVADKNNGDIDSRLLRLTAVPAACMACFCGSDIRAAVNASMRFVEYVMSDAEHEKAESHTDMLRAILAGKVDVAPGDKRPLSQILASYSDRGSYGAKLESVGVRVLGAGDSMELAIGSVKDLVRDKKDRDARKLLMQLPGAKREKVRIAGSSSWTVVIPWKVLGIEGGDDARTW